MAITVTKTILQPTLGGVFSPVGDLSSRTKGTTSNRPDSFVHTSPLIGLNGKDTLRKRARKYHISKSIIGHMLNENPSMNLEKRLKRGLKCGLQVRVNEAGETESRYCGTRFCQVCNGIRTNMLFNRLNKKMIESDKWYMVVLSVQNCKEEELKEMIKRYKRNWVQINKWFKNNKKTKGNGFYTYEITYNEHKNTYHPHIHIMMDDKESADKILELWLKLNHYTKVSNYALQDKGNKVIEMKPHENKKDSAYILELIKYATKPGTKDKNLGTININAGALITIYEALQDKQVFQTFGSFRGIKDYTEEEVSEAVQSSIENINAGAGVYNWNPHFADWINQQTGEILAGNKKTTLVLDRGKVITADSVNFLLNKT